MAFGKMKDHRLDFCAGAGFVVAYSNSYHVMQFPLVFYKIIITEFECLATGDMLYIRENKSST